MTLAIFSRHAENPRPEFNEAGCVHDRAAGASCRACADACPTGALALGEEALELRSDMCNGCMLCAAACPQEAIDPGWQQIDARLARNGATAYLTCAQSGLAKARRSITCVHALSWRDALRLYAAGVRQLAVGLGDCSDCSSQTAQLDHTLRRVNQMLGSRDMPGLEWRYVTRTEWKSEMRDASATPETSLRRRAFLRRMVNPESAHNETNEPDTVESLLGRSKREGSVFPAVPVIDPERCDGCDACTRICPTRALSIAADGQLHYRVDAAHCTGCSLCMDVCQPGAVSVRRWTTSPQRAVALQSQRCRACGVEYHAPSVRLESLCTICAKTHHHRNLFQVDPV